MATTNTTTKFLQILRNFGSATRAQAIEKLTTVAGSDDLYHAGTPVVAFYTEETMTFAKRSASKTYDATDPTQGYKALFGIMGAQKGQIEIFDIQTSVQNLIGGATDNITLTNVANNTTSTWDFRSLGGIQVVIEAMDEFIGTKLTALHNVIGQAETYVAPTTTGSLLANAHSLNEADQILASAVETLQGTVSANAISNTDRSIAVTPGVGNTDVHVNIRSNEHVLANDNTANAGGLYTDIKIAKVVASGQGTGGSGEPAADEIVGTLPANVREAFALKGTDGTMLGQQINIYKDSSLNNVYIGHVDDSLTNADAQGESADTTITNGTGAEALCFIYHLENDKYKLETVDVEAFLTESEFGDGLLVNNHVVSAKLNTTETVITAYGDTPTRTSVLGFDSSGAIKVNGTAIQNAINAKVGTLDVTDAAIAGQYVSAVSETDGVVSVSRTDVSGAVLNNYSKGSDATAIAATDTINQAISKLENQIDNAVSALGNLDGSAVASSATNVDTTPTGDFKVLTSVVEVDGVIKSTTENNGSTAVTLKKVAATGAAADVSIADAGGDYTATTVEGALGEIADRLDAVEGTADTALQSVSGSNAINVDTTTSPQDAQNPKIELKLDSTTAVTNQTVTGTNALQITSDGLFLSEVWDCGEYTVS